MQRDDFNVNEIYNKSDRILWINNILNSENVNTYLGQTKPRKSSSRKYLIPEECNLNISSNKIKDIFIELKYNLLLDESTLSTPIAVGAMFRIFLELSLDHYIKKQDISMPEEGKLVKLKSKICKVTDHMENSKIAKNNDLKCIRQTSSGPSTYIYHIDRLHEIVHDSTIQYDHLSLKSYWNNLQKFFIILWNEPSKTQK